VFPGVVIAEEVDRVGDNGSGDTTIVDLQIFLKAFWNMSLVSACFFDEAFLLFKSVISGLGTNLLKGWIIRISELSDVRLKEFYCILKLHCYGFSFIC